MLKSPPGGRRARGTGFPRGNGSGAGNPTVMRNQVWAGGSGGGSCSSSKPLAGSSTRDWGRSLAARPETGSHQETRGPKGFLSSPHPAAAWRGLAEGRWELLLPVSSPRPRHRPPLGRAGAPRPPGTPAPLPGAGAGPRSLPAASVRRLRGAVVMRKTTLCNLLFNSEEYI